MALISVELAARIGRGDDDLVICDVRFDLSDHDRGRRDYNAAHIAGSAIYRPARRARSTRWFITNRRRAASYPPRSSSLKCSNATALALLHSSLPTTMQGRSRRTSVVDASFDRTSAQQRCSTAGIPREFQPANMLKLILLQSTTQRMKFLLIGQGSSPLTRLSPPSTAAEPSSTLGRRPDIEAIPNRSTRRLAIFLVHSTSSTAAISARTGFTVRLPIFKSV